MFNGSIVALVTPFSGDEIDEHALRRLVRWQIEQGTHGIVPVGTTGESATLTHAEHKRVIEVVVNEVSGEIPVIAGAGSNNPLESMAFADHAATVGADAVLQVAGYYNRPNQEGLYQHFKVLAEHSQLPIIVYNVPPRTIVDIQPETMARIALLPNVVGLKDATCDLSRPIREANLIGDHFCFLSGEDPTAVAYNSHGGQGCISVTANIAPKLCSRMQQACTEGDYVSALNIQKQLMPLHQALFLEPSPAGIKYAGSILGLVQERCRLPIVALTESTKIEIQHAMQSVDLL